MSSKEQHVVSKDKQAKCPDQSHLRKIKANEGESVSCQIRLISHSDNI